MIHLLNANALHIPLADNTVQCVITSPPYWGLRSYMPDKLRLKKDTPQWVLDELAQRNIFPIGRIGECGTIGE